MATTSTTQAATREELLDWLRDAHAMEQQAEQMLSSTAQRMENYPELRQKLEQHLEQTRQQARLLRSCIERLGSSTSAVKDTTARMTGFMQAVSGMFVDDEVVKASLGSYVFEQLEIASYKILIAAAERWGDAETKRICETILKQEEAMARWLDRQLPVVTRKYLERKEARTTAKH